MTSPSEILSPEELFREAEMLNLSTQNVDMLASVSTGCRRICIDDLDSFIYLSVPQAKALHEWLGKVLP